jgi:hypothetical protein
VASFVSLNLPDPQLSQDAVSAFTLSSAPDTHPVPGTHKATLCETHGILFLPVLYFPVGQGSQTTLSATMPRVRAGCSPASHSIGVSGLHADTNPVP